MQDATARCREPHALPVGVSDAGGGGVRRTGHNADTATRGVRRELAASGAGWLFVARFVTGLRNLSGLVAGASGMPLERFLPISAAAALTWALINGLEYYFFGRALASAGTWLQVLLVLAGIAWLVISLGVLRTRALRRLRAQSDVSSTSSP